jgi:hypothetical protein
MAWVTQAKASAILKIRRGIFKKWLNENFDDEFIQKARRKINGRQYEVDLDCFRELCDGEWLTPKKAAEKLRIKNFHNHLHIYIVNNRTDVTKKIGNKRIVRWEFFLTPKHRKRKYISSNIEKAAQTIGITAEDFVNTYIRATEVPKLLRIERKTFNRNIRRIHDTAIAIKVDRNRYVNVENYKKYQKQQQSPKDIFFESVDKIEKTCVICGIKFKARVENTKYCSIKCAQKSMYERAKIRLTNPNTNCRYCGKEFKITKTNIYYCCMEHRRKMNDKLIKEVYHKTEKAKKRMHERSRDEKEKSRISNYMKKTNKITRDISEAAGVLWTKWTSEEKEYMWSMHGKKTHSEIAKDLKRTKAAIDIMMLKMKRDKYMENKDTK